LIDAALIFAASVIAIVIATHVTYRLGEMHREIRRLEREADAMLKFWKAPQ